MKNPFSISFGRVPNEYIRRSQEKEKILEMFTELPVTDQLYVLLGVRGSGKTVTMTDLCDDFRKLNNWIVVKISPVENILDALYQILYHDPRVHAPHADASVALSLPVVSISMNEKAPAENTTKAIDNILSALDKRGLNVLVAIDEVTNTAQMQAFISAFQIFVTNRRPIFFLATALFEEMEALRDVRNLTFLYRAPRLILSPLDIRAMAGTYQRVFGYTKTQCLKLAKETNGYSLAFQILGYVSWEHKDAGILSAEILEEYDQKLAELAYGKLWTELSETDRRVMLAIAKSESHSVKDIRTIAEMDANKFNQYRRRLRDRGLIDVRTYGEIRFYLPRFREFLETEVFEAFELT